MRYREDEHFADVTLACEGHSVKAHRIILCACSSYFQHILRSINPSQHPVLLLSDVRPSDLTALMDFIYFGQVCARIIHSLFLSAKMSKNIQIRKPAVKES